MLSVKEENIYTNNVATSTIRMCADTPQLNEGLKIMVDIDTPDGLDESILTKLDIYFCSDDQLSNTLQQRQSLSEWLARRKIERRRDQKLLRKMLEDYQHFTLDELP